MVQKWVEEVQKGKISDFNVSSEDILKFRDLIVVPQDEVIKRDILEKAHRSKYTVHPESSNMYQDLRRLYWWDKMKKEIAQFVQKYLVCQQVKAKHQKHLGLLQPLEIPEWKWEHITMDFVSGLPRTQKGHDAVWERRVLDPVAVPWIEDVYERVKVIRQKLQTAQSRQKNYADNRRKDLEFEVGDKVFLNVTPLRSLTAGKGKKLQPRYGGPFKILQRVGNVAYRLELPASLSRIHDVFHVSMLKKYHPDPTHVLKPEEIDIDKSLTNEERPV
ncbi:uncharacterized protein [Coffea arabica]|uniref:Uncharacterized protein n=1 Tax=Coffea arabica TaxID=13443 RepID=A0ABM4VUL0_COFAR